MEVEADGRFTFVMKSSRVLETAALSVEPYAVERANADLGLRIDAMTPVPKWYGGHWDLGVAVAGLLRMNGHVYSGSAEPPVRVTIGHGDHRPDGGAG